jgi:hypothetical protein
VPQADDQFVSEPIEPLAFGCQSAPGEPAVPARFRWRGRELQVLAVLEQWKSSSPEAGGGEMYLRRHWYKLAASQVGDPAAAKTVADGIPARIVCTLYCLRRTTGNAARRRWWIYSWSVQ